MNPTPEQESSAIEQAGRTFRAVPTARVCDIQRGPWRFVFRRGEVSPIRREWVGYGGGGREMPSHDAGR